MGDKARRPNTGWAQFPLAVDIWFGTCDIVGGPADVKLGVGRTEPGEAFERVAFVISGVMMSCRAERVSAWSK